MDLASSGSSGSDSSPAEVEETLPAALKRTHEQAGLGTSEPCPYRGRDVFVSEQVEVHTHTHYHTLSHCHTLSHTITHTITLRTHQKAHQAVVLTHFAPEHRPAVDLWALLV